ncbi:MAG TPA: tetratricopeptide repeat protein [Verrucomicrobiae bacterium]|nr:tetratricopeptide repeat protein [Verrucomicrobiae bacterium]
MKFGAVFTLVAFLFGLALPQPEAAGPDDLYLDAYRFMQEAEQLTTSGQVELARQRYADAETNLRKIQGSYPSYNKNAVDFRLEYVQERVKALPGPKPEAAQAAGQKVTRPSAPSSREEQLRDLNGRIAQLEADNAMLQAKLKEALAPQPASLDPREFARAQERITQLEKEKELLRASFQQSQAKQPQAADLAMLDQVRGELEATKKQQVENVARIASLTQENQQFQQQAANPKAPDVTAALKEAQSKLAALEQERAEWQKQRTDLETKVVSASKSQNESSRAKDLEKERDALLKKLNESNKELYDVKARGQSAQNETIAKQNSNLRARLEVFEARKVPFTKEELALLDKNIPKIATSTETKPSKRSAKELPAGAGILITEAERAFAARRYSEAEDKYKQVLKMDEENPVSLANLAAIQLELQKMDEAEANIKKALAGHPEDPYALSLMGMLRFQQGKYEEALDSLSRSAQFDPKNPETQNYLGITLSQQGQREAAETALRKAVMLNPNYAGAHHNLAVVYATQRPPFLELARFHYNKALALGQPANPELEKQLNLSAK